MALKREREILKHIKAAGDLGLTDSELGLLCPWVGGDGRGTSNILTPRRGPLSKYGIIVPKGKRRNTRGNLCQIWVWSGKNIPHDLHKRVKVIDEKKKAEKLRDLLGGSQKGSQSNPTPRKPKDVIWSTVLSAGQEGMADFELFDKLQGTPDGAWLHDLRGLQRRRKDAIEAGWLYKANHTHRNEKTNRACTVYVALDLGIPQPVLVSKVVDPLGLLEFAVQVQRVTAPKALSGLSKENLFEKLKGLHKRAQQALSKEKLL